MRRTDWLQLGAGLASRVPGLLRALRGPETTRGSDSARYCYAVWLRHLVRARENGLPTRFETVAEIGPGDSLGSGLAALLCGSRRYLALDVLRYAPQARNLRMLDELAALFRERAAIPDDDELPNVKPRLDDYRFPHEMLADDVLDSTLSADRIESIRAALLGQSNPHEIEIAYCVPWDEAVESETVDLVFSQACLEHVSDLETTYAAMAAWLRPGGIASHQIDLRSHKLTPEWDGHRRFSPPVWSLMCGARPNLINREPLSAHLASLDSTLERVAVGILEREPETPRDALAPAFRDMSEADRRASGVFLQARKPA